MATDPVCGMDVDEKQAHVKTEYEGETYFFCSQECQEEFEDDPETYLEDLEELEGEDGAERKTA